MMLAFLGQKKNTGKHLLKDNSTKDLLTELQEIESDFGMIKEKQVRLTQRKLLITPQLFRGHTTADMLSSANGTQPFSSQKTSSMPKRTRHTGIAPGSNP